MNDYYSSCTLCPRMCRVDRNLGQMGFCRETSNVYLAWSGLHKGEEPFISGENGSGMFFFRGCSLSCRYCQNYQISTDKTKFKCPQIDLETAKKLCLEMQNDGANTISFVTAEHYAPFVAELIKSLKADGFSLPFVFNTSGWISVSCIDLLLPYIDIWLWDTKANNKNTSSLFCGDSRYGEEEKKSFIHLYNNIKEFDLQNTNKGIIVRHLVLPGCIDDAKDVIRGFSKYKDKCYFSLMKQFVYTDGNAHEKIDMSSYDELDKLLFSLDIENGFIQETSAKEEEWLPDFTKDNPFPAEYATASSYFLKLKSEIMKS